MIYEVYTDRAGKWRWRLRSGNYNWLTFNSPIIAISGEGHATKKECIDEIALVKQSIKAPVRNTIV